MPGNMIGADPSDRFSFPRINNGSLAIVRSFQLSSLVEEDSKPSEATRHLFACVHDRFFFVCLFISLSVTVYSASPDLPNRRRERASNQASKQRDKPFLSKDRPVLKGANSQEKKDLTKQDSPASPLIRSPPPPHRKPVLPSHHFHSRQNLYTFTRRT
jgi:hypothetical protein